MTTFSTSQLLQDQQVLVSTGIPVTLQAVQASWRSVAVPVLLITAQLLVACLLLLFLSVSDAIDARSHEVALAKLRGRGGWRTVVYGMSEPVLLLLVALPIGILIGWAATDALGRLLLRPGTAVTLTPLAWAAAAVATAGGAGRCAAGGAADAAPPGARRVAPVRAPGGRPDLGDRRRPGHRRRGRAARAGGDRADRLGPPRCARPARARPARAGRRGHRLPPAATGLPGGFLPRTSRRGSLGVFLALRHVARRPGGVRTTIVLATAFALAAFAVTRVDREPGQRASRRGRPGRRADRADGQRPAGQGPGRDRRPGRPRRSPGRRRGPVHQRGQRHRRADRAGGGPAAVRPGRGLAARLRPRAAGRADPAARPARPGPGRPHRGAPSGSPWTCTPCPRRARCCRPTSLPGPPRSAWAPCPAHGTVTRTGQLTGCPCVLRDLDLSPPTHFLQSPVTGSVTITRLQVHGRSGWTTVGSGVLAAATRWRPGHADSPPDRLTASPGRAGLEVRRPAAPGRGAPVGEPALPAAGRGRPPPCSAPVSTSRRASGWTAAPWT